MKSNRIVPLLVMTASLLLAHGVNIFTSFEGDSIQCQCYYNDGSPVRNQMIEVFRTSGEKLLGGQTDEAGYFRFVPGVKEELKVVLHAGMGHQAETVIKASVIPEEKKPRVSKPDVSQKAVEMTPEKPGLDEEQVRTIVREVTQNEFNSIRELIVKQQRGATLTTIIGGIGYIFGIFGLLLYLRRRKQN